MKLIGYVILGLCLFFGCAKASYAEDDGAQEVMKELDDFQRSLSNWMKNLDSLRTQFGTIQKTLSDRLAPLENFDKTMKGLEAKLNKVMSKIEVIEKTSSLEGVKNEIESFNKTLEDRKSVV